MNEKKLFLIDGNSLLYRSYYAIQRLSTSRGFPTNAIYGFISTLKKIMEQEKPDYLGIVFDTKGLTARHALFKDYKAQRKPMPDDLQVQVPVLKNVIRAMNIPCVESVGHEADDVLGTLACRAAGENVHAVIVTTDKDLLQIIDEHASVYNPAKEIRIAAADVKDYFGVQASQVTDVLALWGDPSDNIPGVPGIGEKTSKELINRFGSLDNLLRNLGLIKNPRLKDNIERNLETLELSRRLVTIDKDLAIPFKLDEFAISEPDYGEIGRLFRELEFTTLLAEYVKTKEPDKREYAAVFDADGLEALAARIRKAASVSLDTETDSSFPTRARLVGISLATEPGKAFYVPLGHDYLGAPKQIPKETVLRILGDVLKDPRIKKIGQNIKYDYIVLKRAGLPMGGIDLDPMVLSYLLEPNWGKHGLDKLAVAYLQINKTPYESIAGKGKNALTMNQVDIERVTPYACLDADLALRLSSALWPKIQENRLEKLYCDIERPLIEVLAEMEIWGVKIDLKALRELSEELGTELASLEKTIHEMSGEAFNINSPQQLSAILFHKLNLPARKKTKTTRGYSTSLDILQELAPLHPLAQHVLEYRQLSKLKSTYADALPQLVDPETGRIHTSYNQTVASTGRLSSSDPNLQNIPVRGEMGARFRQAFIPEKGYLFLSADYSQIELRVLAHLSEDPALMETFLNDRDVHDETARRVFGADSLLFADEQRRRAKIINFSIIYGTSAFSLAKELGASNSEAQKFIDLYFEKYPKVKDFLESKVREAADKGYSETICGRKRQVPELRQAGWAAQQAGRRIALNTPIQGSAADIMKMAMIGIWKGLKKRKLRTKMILQVHDELVFEVPAEEREEVEELVRDRMQNVLEFKVPLKVHLGWGANWAETK